MKKENYLSHNLLCSNYLWWKPIEVALGNINLKSIRITCPRCKQFGIITTRWIKGPTLKPIFILHTKFKKIKRVCELSEEEASSIRGKVDVYKSDIKKLLESRKSFVLFSGGKDSVATLVYLKDIAKKVNVNITAIYVDTTAGLPENTKYVRKVCKYLGVRLKIVKPKIDYFTLAKKWGIPSFKYRWCCRELKIKPIENYLKKIKEPKVVFDGIRAVESNIRKEYIPIWYHPSFKCLSVSPIFNWSDQKVFSFINNNGIPKTILHSLGTSTECWCGAYKTETDFRNLYKLSKDLFDKLSKIEHETNNRFTFLYKNGEKKTLKELEKEILEERSN